jgi:DNA-binding response OmpR family regulator
VIVHEGGRVPSLPFPGSDAEPRGVEETKNDWSQSPEATGKMESVLIIDDDVELCVMLRDYLFLHGMDLAMEHNGTAGLEAAARGAFDLVILDLRLPGLGGFNLLGRLRAQSSVNVMLLTARGGERDRIAGLEAGADDYLGKPFNPRELLARIRAIFRRADALRRTGMYREASVLAVCGFVMDLTSRAVCYKGEPLNLTNVEFSLLEVFLKSPGMVLDREDLVERILDRPFNPLDRSLDMHISRLRRKLDEKVPLGCQIKTIRSAGYLFVATDCGCES